MATSDGILLESVALPNLVDSGKPAFLLHDVFSAEECSRLIQRTEEQGYVEALLNIGGGQEVLQKDYRNSLRCIIDDIELSAEIFRRIKRFLPTDVSSRKIVGLNERLRFLKYESGHFFGPHADGCYVRPENGETSMLTLQLYLNGGATGGETRFLPFNDTLPSVDVVPKPGMMLVFKHDILHEGALVTEGVKYVMRTDIMYTSLR